MGGSSSCGGCSGNTRPPEDSVREIAPIPKRNNKVHKIGFGHQATHDLNDDETAAWHRPHHCTDLGALLIFVVGLVGVGWVMNYARTHGDLRRLYHGLNFYGELCGVDERVINEPYLYWCTKASGPLPTNVEQIISPSNSLDLAHPICVASCPSSDETHHSCYQGKKTQEVWRDPLTDTFVENVTYTFRLVSDYETRPFAGHYCLPLTIERLSQLRGKMEWGSQALMLHAGEVIRSWVALIAAFFLAVILGYFYLFFVGKFVDELVYVFIGISTLLPMVAGAAILFKVFHEGTTEEFLEHVKFGGVSARIPSTGNKEIDMGIGFILISVGFLVTIAACCLRHSIELIIGSIESATEALFAMPTLLFSPILSVIAKMVLLAVEIVGFVFVMSCGKVSRMDVGPEMVPGGVTRSFKFDDDEVKYLAFYAFMALWVLELCFALEQFVLAYSTQLWFFKDYDANGRKGFIGFPVVRGVAVGLTYHLGTLALGSLLLTFLEAIHFVLAMVYKRTQEAEATAGTCSVSRILAGCCCCCMTCFECFIRFMNKNAYIVTAVESEPFCHAAQIAFNVVANEIAAIGGLAIALKVFVVAGIVLVTSLGAYLTWILVHSFDIFSDPKSQHYVAAPEYVTAVAAVISAIVSATFMVMFDMVADTILFCWALDRKYRSEHGLPAGNNVPPRLKALLNADGVGEPLINGNNDKAK